MCVFLFKLLHLTAHEHTKHVPIINCSPSQWPPGVTFNDAELHKRTYKQCVTA